MVSSERDHEAAVAELVSDAKRWVAGDPSGPDRAELSAIIARVELSVRGAAHEQAAGDGPLAELTARMLPLRFGTAGLRAPVRAGRNGMNRAVVLRTTAGVADWLAEQDHGGTVVIGRDARHGSEEFAAAAAAVFAAAGFDTLLLPAPLPTPVLAFAVRELDAVAGVQITASHNPPSDNGYKLYLGFPAGLEGAQPVAPADAEIERAVAAQPPATQIPQQAGYRTAGHELLERYIDRAASLPAVRSPRLPVVATALHGVGADVLTDVLRRAGFPALRLVPEQAEPDPDFPTLSFPNPEEPEATEALLRLGQRSNASLGIALDPDADRCALAVPGPSGWRMLRGDETGVLLAEHLLEHMPDPARVLLASTIVSSSMLEHLAAHHGAAYARTLTGFKWLVRAAPAPESASPEVRLRYAYEEALGHCVDPEAVLDKDGISTAVMACSAAAAAQQRGTDLLGWLDELAVRHGVFHTGAFSLRLSDPRRSTAIMQDLRTRPPVELAGIAVQCEDLQPETDAVRLHGQLEGVGLRVIVRPSGTEPKLKSYLEIVVPVPGAEQLAASRELATATMSRLKDELAALL